MRYFIFIILGVFCSLSSKGQFFNSYRNVTIVAADTLTLDSLSVVPTSFQLFNRVGQEVDESQYEILFDKAQLVFKDSLLWGKKFSALFRVFPVSLSMSKAALVHGTASSENQKVEDDWYMREATYATYEEESKIQANGNISRGLSSGNGQNLVMNSNLNLQLSGKVDDQISIEAVLSDKNVPVQPNGYTQQINAFDQIYIRLYDSLRYLQIGDVDINGSNSYFLKFQRRLQGGDFAGTFDLKNKLSNYSQASAAIAKGTFNRSEFSGIEGIQGPYPLFGVNNERFIVVLAGSERVFVDGQLLKRGEQADYVINYNTAELTFMPNRLITKDSRIIVEFEYSDKNYNRFLVYGQTQIKNEKSQLGIQFFSESDAKNQTVNQSLTDEQKQVLALAGDNSLRAVVPNVDSVGFDENQVLYALLDTVVDGFRYDSIYKVSYNPDSAFYQLGFAFVGQGKGSYQLVPSAANGKVYVWTAPMANVLQGAYEPIQLLVAPKKQQVYVVNMAHRFSYKNGVDIEAALSNRDLNTFSSIDGDDNVGMAVKTKVFQVFDLSTRQLKAYSQYEYVNKDFNAVERFRNAEFNRDWNILSPATENQHLVTGGLSLMNKKKELGDLNVEYLNQSNAMEGVRLNFELDIQNDLNKVDAMNSLLLSKDLFRETQFYRHRLAYQRKLNVLSVGFNHEVEDNQQFALNTDSLLNNSMRFLMTEVYAKMDDSLKRTLGVKFRNRVDYLPFENEVSLANVSNDMTVESKMTKLKNNRLVLSATYRNLQIKNEKIISPYQSEDHFLSRVDHQLKLAKRVFSFSTFYEVGSGLEAKQDFVYIEVAPGQGVYVWVDYNGDNIQALDEFEVSKFPEEANYIRIYTPSNEYTKAYSLKFNHTLKINPAFAWRNEEGVKKLVSRFSNSFSLRQVNKQTLDNFVARLNPFYRNMEDSSLLNNRTGLRNTFSFNRSNPKFGADWVFNFNSSKNLLVNGFDKAKQRGNQLTVRWNITRHYMLRNNSNYGDKEFQSEFFSNRDYHIQSLSNGSTFQWQPGNKFRLSMNYTYFQKQNLWGDEVSNIQEFGPEVKYNQPGKGTFTIKASSVLVAYNDTENSSLSYEMLNGFVEGQNYTWNVNWSQNLSKYLRLTVVYSGRKATESDVVHLGQVNLSAFF